MTTISRPIIHKFTDLSALNCIQTKLNTNNNQQKGDKIKINVQKPLKTLKNIGLVP